MDVEKRMNLIKEFSAEIITENELREVLETKRRPIAYDGFEPSGLAHIALGIYRSLNIQNLIKAKIRFKLYLADWFAWINNKMGGDLEKIKKVGEYLLEVWKASGLDIKKIEVVWASELVKRSEYWKRVITIAKNVSISRANRALTIMGRKAGEMKEVAQYFYPMMQVADIFELDVDICQLGLDQRRANILAREIAEKLKWKKPIIVSHHMLLGLEGEKRPEGYDENLNIDIQISSKMSKSKPQTCIFVHDDEKQVESKIKKAFCPPKQVENNPILSYFKHIIFRKFKNVEINRERQKDTLEFFEYNQLEKNYREGAIHPLDLKNSCIFYLNQILMPIRKYFEKNKKAKRLYEFLRSQEITR